MEEKKQYTVVGLNGVGLRFADHVSAADPTEAIKTVKQERDPEGDREILIAGVFEGELTSVDSGHFAQDDC